MKEVSVRLNSDLPVILDGAMGTQLLDRGFDLTPALWSAEILEVSGKNMRHVKVYKETDIQKDLFTLRNNKLSILIEYTE